MLAYAKLEPFGPLSDDFRAGQIAAIVANVNRDSKRSPEPFLARDFFQSLGPARSSEPILLDDPKKQADLIRQQIFGFAPGTRKAGKKKHG